MELYFVDPPEMVNFYYDEKKRRCRVVKRPDGPLLFDLPVRAFLPLTPGYFMQLGDDEAEEIERVAAEKYHDGKPFSSRWGAFVPYEGVAYIFWDGLEEVLKESAKDRFKTR